MKVVQDYEIVSHGVDSPGYFPGIASEGFTSCYVGVEQSESAALEEALEGLAQAGVWDCAQLEDRLSFDAEAMELSDRTVCDDCEVADEGDCENCEAHHYVGIKVR